MWGGGGGRGEGGGGGDYHALSSTMNCQNWEARETPLTFHFPSKWSGLMWYDGFMMTELRLVNFNSQIDCNLRESNYSSTVHVPRPVLSCRDQTI